MSKPKEVPKVYTISETIYVNYQVVAMSEEDAQDAYRNMLREEWMELVIESASCNFCDDELTDEEKYDPKEHGELFPFTYKAKKALK